MVRRAAARRVLRLASLSLIVLGWMATGEPSRALAADPEIPAAVGFVNDHAAVMSEPERAKLEAFLDQVKQKTGVEFAVLTVRTTAPLSPSVYKVQVFQRWGIGRKDQDDGLLMLVALEEREVRFETGYGLEGTLPDGLQSRIFRDQMAPRFRAGDIPGGIVAGVLECARRIGAERGVALEWDGRTLRYERDSRRTSRGRERMVVLVLVILFVVVMAILSNRGGGGGMYRPRRRYRGFPWGGAFGGGLGGWGSFGGGGFGGGGFGGGSFGGFGGGASGGGGGGGKW